MIHLNAFDFPDDLICDGINDADVIAGAVGLNNPDFIGGRRRLIPCLSADPCCQNLKLRVVLRHPVFPAVVAGLPTCLFCERMDQKFAFQWISSNHPRPHNLEIFAGFFFVPHCGAGRERLKAHGCSGRVTGHAARVAVPLRQKNGLDLRFEVLEVEGR